jgi:hypothetical protein
VRTLRIWALAALALVVPACAGGSATPSPSPSATSVPPSPTGSPAPSPTASPLPAIVVEQPAIGAGVTSPVTVSGTADVFEGTVSVRILDSSGGVVGRAFTTATCGSGCRGTFSVQVRFHVSGTGVAGTVMVFEASAENGKPINAQRIPVTLKAATA